MCSVWWRARRGRGLLGWPPAMHLLIIKVIMVVKVIKVIKVIKAIKVIKSIKLKM